MMNISFIEQIASKTRNEFENGTVNKSELKQLYQEYNPIEDAESFVKTAESIFPKLNCGLTSVFLKKLLPRSRIMKGKYQNNDHTFLLLNDSIVVDITADQYDGPKVYVGSLKNPWCLK